LEYGFAFVIGACLIGLIMSWGVGANDLANIMSTTMGSKAITVRQAMIIAVIFEFAGAFLGGVHVTNTIRSGIINTAFFNHTPDLLILGMIATLLASMVWIIFASFVGMPVSITNAIVGALVGFGAVVLGVHGVHWHKVWLIVLSWVGSPLIAGMVAYWLFILVRVSILSARDPVRNVRRYLPIFFFLVGIVLAIMIVLRDLAHFGIQLNNIQRYLIIIIIAVLITIVGTWLTRRIILPENPKRYQRFEYVEKLFGVLMAFTACAMVFAHGSNDVAIAMGPVAAVVSIVKHGGDVAMQDPLSLWTMLLGCVGVVIGLFMYGRKVIVTVGSGITALTPSRAFAATIAAACAVILSTSGGIPVSATQTLVGGVFGVGLARGIGALNLNVIRNIFLSWFITVPAAALLAILFFDLMRWRFMVL